MTADQDYESLPGLAPADAVIAAEQAVLGAAIQSRAAAEAAVDMLAPGDFWRPHHQTIAETITALVEAGDPVSPVSVLDHLTTRGVAGTIGGGATLLQLTQRYSSSVKYDARIVADDAFRRRVLEALANAQRLASEPGFDPDRHVDVIRSAIDQATAKVTGEQPPTIGEVVLRRLEDLETGQPTVDAIPLPWADMHRLLAGLRPGQLVVIGARPGIGKSVTGLDIARSAAVRNGMPTLLHSLEMTAAEVADRLMAAEATVELARLREENLKPSDWERIARVQDRVQAAPLIVDDDPRVTLARVRARLRGMARTAPAKLVIIDYLGLMQAPKAESRERAVAELSRGLKLMAMEFGVAIVALHQLNRESLKRNDKRPTMADLRDSGAVEQDADIVILLHREDAHDKESPRSGELDLIVDKNRSGPTGLVSVAFQGHYARTGDMAVGHWPTTPTDGRHLRAVD
ncbi:replicative DNA helicase [Actinoallomurus spadix]|uniref:DNA 5'-3' helicase n=1 Tax=Actinoallomurus spadix TaxID=79912 RepID=A0ABP3GKU0_9ACTN|nr:replicative DNA helicase [Actinoallomurus spadix]MCO5986553.1 replicative DNA helicase [Actinoallomurus spadix]